MALIYFIDKLTLQGRSTVGDSAGHLCFSLLGVCFVERINIRTSLNHDRISAGLGYKTYLQLLEERRISTVSHVKVYHFLTGQGLGRLSLGVCQEISYRPPSISIPTGVIGHFQFDIYKFHSEYLALSDDLSVRPGLPCLTFRNYLVMLNGSDIPLNHKDIIVMASLIASFVIEIWADEQQWVYQTTKHAAPSKSTRSQSRQTSHVSYCQPRDLQRGFITGGLFRYSRHPNFACEQLNWYLFYAFGCIATVCLSYVHNIMFSTRCGIGQLPAL
jgi:hypothetical protein